MHIGRFIAFSALGWAIENMARPGEPAFYSRVWGGLKIPLLPIYGVGGLLLPHVHRVVATKPLPVRGAAYAGAFTALELVACKLEGAVTEQRSWGYGADGKACVGLLPSLWWGALGLAAERL